MNFIAIIPARYGSSRFPGKPLADIAGKPMIQHVYERVSKYVPCYVATDDMRIEDCVRAFGGRVVMTSEAHRSGTDRCREALDIIERSEGRSYDIVINVQGDEPFVSDDHLQKIISAFDDSSVRIATLVKRFSDAEDIFNPNTPKVVTDKYGNALYFSRSVIPYCRGMEQQRWQSEFPYLKHIGMYAYLADVLREITGLGQGDLELAESLEQLRWLGNGIPVRTVETAVETVSVDTPEDLAAIVADIKKGSLIL